MDKQDLVVIGGGTSGFIVAIGALKLGLKVILIDKNSRLGGTALHVGCVPSKTMLHVAQIAHYLRHAQDFGLDAKLMPVNLAQVNAHISQVVTGIERQDALEAQQTFQRLGGQILLGQPKFIDNHTLLLNNEKIVAKKFAIATGSRTLYPDIPGLAQVEYVTNETVFKQQKLPASIIILGGRPAAIEFAQIYARLGAKVTVVVAGDSILPQEDAELASKIREALVQEGVEFYFNTQVEAAYWQQDKKFLECLHASGEKFVLNSAEIFVSLGRKANFEGLGLENAGVEYSEEGILVSKKLRTTNKKIYALGDVISSPYKLTHAAEYQANIVLSNAVFRFPAHAKYHGFPYVIFTNPEYAQVGLTEQQAIEQGLSNIEIARFDFKDLDSSAIQSVNTGLIKIVTQRGKIIGASIVGPQASNLIAEWGLAINLGAHITDVAATIHAYPTLAQINRRVASKQTAKNLFNTSNNWLLRYWQLIFA